MKTYTKVSTISQLKVGSNHMEHFGGENYIEVLVLYYKVRFV